MEMLLNDKCKKVRISKNRFTNEEDIKLIDTQNKYLFISHLYNNMQISKCFWNGCDTCSLNPNLIDSYKSVCSKMEYSDKIKNIGNQFINDNLENNLYQYILGILITIEETLKILINCMMKMISKN